MAEFLGTYKGRLKDGHYWEFPFFKIHGAGETISFTGLSGTVYSCKLTDEGQHNAGKIYLDYPGYLVRYASSTTNLSYRPYYERTDGTLTAVDGTPLWGGSSTGKGFHITILSIDDDGYYYINYIQIYENNVPTFYTYSIYPPSDNHLGHATVTWAEGRSGSVTPISGNRITDPGLIEWLKGLQPEEAVDPYENDGEEPSEPGGGEGEEDEEDEVDFTDTPSTSITATGFLTIFCPNWGQLHQLATYMWSSFDVDNWRKLFANPMDAILGLHIIPVPANITGTKEVKVAGISTTVEMPYTSLRYVNRPMGSCDIPKKWGAYLDYNPYTKISIFLPYIGFKELDADDVMGRTISLQYIIDILTGACVAELKCGDTVLYSWSGNCANEVPVSSSDWRNALSSAIGIAGTIATTVATQGASAPMVAGAIASVGANSLNLKPNINRSGSLSGSAGFIGHQRPYIIRSVPNVVIPANQNRYIGYPSFVTVNLGSLIGYNEIESIHLEGIPATGNELTEIETLLKGGVIF